LSGVDSRLRVLPGGSWNNCGKFCRSAHPDGNSAERITAATFVLQSRRGPGNPQGHIYFAFY
jgi:hypothetical protein